MSEHDAAVALLWFLVGVFYGAALASALIPKETK